jgi:hypothetical protein
LPLRHRWKLITGTKPFPTHNSDVEWAVFIYRKETFIGRQIAKYFRDSIYFQPVVWVIARKHYFCLAPLITARAYRTANRPNRHSNSTVFQSGVYADAERLGATGEGVVGAAREFERLGPRAEDAQHCRRLRACLHAAKIEVELTEG